jgi:two-component system CheB/CheR fusion protein
VAPSPCRALWAGAPRFSVRLRLPVIPDREISPSAAPQVAPHFLQGRTILVAEDNPINAEILSRILKKYDARVVLAENGALAVQQFKDVRLGWMPS